MTVECRKWCQLLGAYVRTFTASPFSTCLAGVPAVFQKHFGRYRPGVMAVSADQTRHLLWRLQHGEAPVKHPVSVWAAPATGLEIQNLPTTSLYHGDHMTRAVGMPHFAATPAAAANGGAADRHKRLGARRQRGRPRRPCQGGVSDL